MERETGIEPAIFSLGRWLKIENKEHSEFRHLFQAIEFTGNSQVFATRLLMEFTGRWAILRNTQDFSVASGPSMVTRRFSFIPESILATSAFSVLDPPSSAGNIPRTGGRIR
jgi:hypothetical protein